MADRRVKRVRVGGNPLSDAAGALVAVLAALRSGKQVPAQDVHAGPSAKGGDAGSGADRPAPVSDGAESASEMAEPTATPPAPKVTRMRGRRGTRPVSSIPGEVHPKRNVRRMSFGRQRLIVDAFLVLISLGLLAGAFWQVAGWSTADETCAGCHESIKAIEGSHESVSCASCHRPAGVSGALRYATSLTDMLAASYFTGSEPGTTTAELVTGACIRCHTLRGLDRFDGGAGVRVYHSHLYELGISCEQCHESTGHRVVLPTRPRAVMDICLECHDGSQQSASCDTCHTSRPSDVVSGWRRHDQVDVTYQGTCEGCHTKKRSEDCVRCHGGYVMPHPTEWRSGGHLFDGLTDKDGCYVCHKPNDDVPPPVHGQPYGGYGGGFCNRCHAFPSPHGPSSAWQRSHGAASRGVQVAQPVCVPCHGTDNMVKQCTVCHNDSICANCHRERDRRAAR